MKTFLCSLWLFTACFTGSTTSWAQNTSSSFPNCFDRSPQPHTRYGIFNVLIDDRKVSEEEESVVFMKLVDSQFLSILLDQKLGPYRLISVVSFGVNNPEQPEQVPQKIEEMVSMHVETLSKGHPQVLFECEPILREAGR